MKILAVRTALYRISDMVKIHADWLNYQFRKADWLDYTLCDADWLNYKLRNADWLLCAVANR